LGAERLVVAVSVVSEKPGAGIANPCGFRRAQKAARASVGVQEDEEGRKDFECNVGRKSN
jgi:hypothetical protein